MSVAKLLGSFLSTKLNNISLDLLLNKISIISFLIIFISMKANAALSGEQRQPPNLNHCTLNT
ncbi:hypothetical protein CGH69_22445 [Vibrio parahaemolyticus]|nr:hypothetical protein CGH69_22445 [Vibrio parahaemolyticus]